MALFCVSCGTQLPDDVKFCTTCGTPVQRSAPDEANAPAEQAPFQTQAEPVDQVSYQTQTVPVDQTAQAVPDEPVTSNTFDSPQPDKPSYSPPEYIADKAPESFAPVPPRAPAAPPQAVQQPYQRPAQPQPNPQQQWQPAVPPRYEQQSSYSAAPSETSPYALMGAWNIALSFILMNIPVIGLIVSIVWALGGCKKIIRRNFARAYLLLIAIGLVLCIITGLIASLFFADALKDIFEGLFPGYTIDIGLFG